MKKTKIICTLGPSTDNEEVLKELMLSGMDVCRLNFSHQTLEEQQVRVDTIKRLREENGLATAILGDTKGPEIRTGLFPDGGIMLADGQSFTLTTKERMGDIDGCFITYKDLPGDVNVGTRILINDGLIELVCESKTETDIVCKVIHGGKVTSKKGINVPDVRLSMPFISEADRRDLEFIAKNDFDYLAASFVRSADDIVVLREELKKFGGEGIRIIAKIENRDGIRNVDEILDVADGIMVARGDMGVEIPFEEIPAVQKELIKQSYLRGKMVVTATQMLESMISNPRPTRAEATDIANAINEGTSAIMLSGETAAGKFPIEALKTMVKIATSAEDSIDYYKQFHTEDNSVMPDNITNAISHATCTTAYDLKAKAIITVTKSGHTAKNISKFRPDTAIIGCTTTEKVRRQLNLVWGVTPLIIDEKKTTEELFNAAAKAAKDAGIATDGDLIVITAGVPVGKSGTTNILKVKIIGE